MPDIEEPEKVLFTAESEIEARSHLGRTVLVGGCPYRVTGVRPKAALVWEVRGVGLPVHGDADQRTGWHPPAG